METYNSLELTQTLTSATMRTMIKATVNEGLEILYRNRSISDIVFDDIEQFNAHCDDLNVQPLPTEAHWSKEFNIPQYYKEIDVEDYIKKLVPAATDPSENPLARVEEELALYKARNLYPILQLMIYIVDTMRKNNLVWGVGRGSSVASYVLYLLGVHKINSIKYNLNIKEFLK